MQKLKLLFLCTGNSCRSQMAEAWAKILYADVYDVYSAGVETHGLNPTAVLVMREAGVDMSMHQSKTVQELSNSAFDWVITVCDNASESCPLFLGDARIVHHGFDDPPKLTQGLDEKASLAVYRRVRDEIKAFVEELPHFLENIPS